MVTPTKTPTDLSSLGSLYSLLSWGLNAHVIEAVLAKVQLTMTHLSKDSPMLAQFFGTPYFLWDSFEYSLKAFCYHNLRNKLSPCHPIDGQLSKNFRILPGPVIPEKLSALILP